MPDTISRPSAGLNAFGAPYKARRTPMIQDLPVPSVQFADDICNFATTLDGLRASIKCTLDYCQANRLRVNMAKSCYSVFNTPKSTSHRDLAVSNQLLHYEAAPCYLGVSLSDNKAEQNFSAILQKASRASYALRSMLDSAVAAKVVNKLYEQLIEPILLYAVEQWLPYIHPCMVDKSGPVKTFASPSSQLSTEDTVESVEFARGNFRELQFSAIFTR